MLFNSIDFAIFLPIVFGLYWLVSSSQLRLQNALLLLASYVFYGWWDWRFLSLIFISSLVDFYVGKNLGSQQDPLNRKLLLWLSIGVNLGFLGFFKYYNFFAESLVEAFTIFGSRLDLNALQIVLPVGISFYTFQTMSYTLDIYRGKMQPTTDAIAFFTFVSFFPQLVAGPIERAAHLLPQFHQQRLFSYDYASDGLKKMLWGFFMKVAVADRLGLYVAIVYGHVEMHDGLSYLVATFFFAIQIYCDFAGYSLIAIGCAQLFGFGLMENFRRPYFALNFKDFWSRWHISLSTWFRDYVYIPLGGSRVSPARQHFNLFITFVISGLWHGANWTFVIWGAIHGVYQIAEKSISRYLNWRWPRFLQTILIFGLTCLAWIFFRADTLSDAIHILLGIFTHPGQGIYIGDKGIFAFSILAIVILFLADGVSEYYPQIKLLHHRHPLVRYATIWFLLVYILALGVFDGSQFIYFQF